MNIIVTNRTRVRIPVARTERHAERIFRELVRLGWKKFRTYELGIAFVGDRESEILNQRFLHKPKPANVLSFDYGTSGEIILNPGVIRREARKARESFVTRLSALLVHGAVHLAGIHHERSRAVERKADRLEAALGKYLGLEYPAGAVPAELSGRGRSNRAKHFHRH